MQRKILVGSVQINPSFFSQEYLPYSIGILQAYAKKYCDEIDKFEFLIPIHKTISVKKAVEKLSQAEIVFFSTYIWNANISLEIARQLKQKDPNMFIVFGGPSIPSNDVEGFLKRNRFVDIAFVGDGEVGFSAILSAFAKKEKIITPGACYIKNDIFIDNGEAPRILDIDTIPSPYLEGTFEPLMKANPEIRWNILWETNRGCPFSCTYCEWGIDSKTRVTKFNTERLEKEMDWVAKNKIEFIKCCDNNFGILERDNEIIKYVIKTKKESGYPQAFSIQNTKNFKDHTYEAYKRLSEVGLNTTVALALQSVNLPTLTAIKRNNIGMEQFKKAQEMLASMNVKTVTDLILGLPEETYETFSNGVSAVIENGQHNRVNFNDLVILMNSDMGDKDYQKKYGLKYIERKPIAIHRAEEDEEIPETEFAVISTKSMPRNDWVKAKTFSLETSLLYNDKILQIPFMFINKLYRVSFKELIEAFINNEKYEIIKNIKTFFEEAAKSIQEGKESLYLSKKWLGIWWPHDEFQFIETCQPERIDKFYNEAFLLLKDLVKNIDTDLLKETINFNKHLLKLPFQKVDKIEKTGYNIWEVYKGILTGNEVPLEKKESTYKILCSEKTWDSWDKWCEEVVWFTYKSNNYIYNCERMAPA